MRVSTIRRFRMLNRERGKTIDQELIDRAAPLNTAKMGWLQLTPEQKDMGIVGPEPLWEKYLREHRSNELDGQTSELASSQFVLSPRLRAIGSGDTAEQLVDTNPGSVCLDATTE